MRHSKVLARLRADQPVMMCSVTMGVSAMTAEMAGLFGFHAVWLDMEHRPLTWREVETLIMGTRLGDTDAVVRIRKEEGYATFMRPLQDGASGLMVPHVRSAGEAARWVEYARYAPQGRRGLENVMRDADMGLATTADYLAHTSRETFLILQIEDLEAIAALDEIAAVPGYDILFVGPADLSHGYGVTGELRHPKVQAAIEEVAAAAARHGKWWGLPVSSVDDAARYIDLGGRFFNFGGDYGWIRSGMQQVSRAFGERFGN